MERNMIFFGEQGLSSTSANFISNLAKEYYRSKETILDNMQFCNTQVSVLATGGSATISQGIDAATLQSVPQMLDSIAKAKSLIAWLREAIKAKEFLVTEAKTMSVLNYCEKFHPEMYEAFANPDEYITEHSGDVLSESEITNQVTGKLTQQQWYDYFYAKNFISLLEEIAGHPDSLLFKYERQLFDYKMNPLSDTGDLRYVPTIENYDLDKRIEEMQTAKQNVETQSAELRSWVDEEIKKAKNLNFVQANDVRQDIEKAKNDILAEREVYCKQEAYRLSQLKIAIPDSLKGIYEEIKNLAKK